MKRPPKIKTYLLGIDQGSSATKGILFDPQRRRIVAKARVKITTKKRQENGYLFVEQDPQEILASVRSVIAQLSRRAPRESGLLLGIASQRSSFLLMDPASGRSLTPVISWQDTRALELVQRWRAQAPRLYERSGLYLTPYYTLCKLLWVLEKNKTLKNRVDQGAAKLAFIPTFLVRNLTLEKRCVTDPTLAQRSLLFNIATGSWDQNLLTTFGIPQSLLPDLLETTDHYGTLEMSGRRIAIKAMIGDQQAAYLALTQGRPHGQALINLGTGGFLLVGTGAAPQRRQGLLTGIAWRRNGQTQYLVEGTVTSISGVLKWLAALGLLQEKEKISMPEAEDIGRLPLACGSFGGLASPYWRGDIKVKLEGIDHNTTREHLRSAFLFGLSHLFWEICQHLSNPPTRIMVSGGLSRSQGLLQILANYLNVPLTPVEDADLTALGAALAASPTDIKITPPCGSPVRPQGKYQTYLEQYRSRAHQALKALLS